jgi:hypothetical protein
LQLNLKLIKTLTYILFGLCALSSCVTDVALPLADEKYFVVCELRAQDRVIATASNSGNIVGELPDKLENPDTLRMTIATGTNDDAYALVYDKKFDFYTIEPSYFTPTAGQSYFLKGLANSKNKEVDPQIVVPTYIYIDSVRTLRLPKIEGDPKESVQIEVYFNRPRTQESFFYVNPVVKGAKSVTPKFDVNIAAYKRLLHKPGFLVDYSRLDANMITVTLEIESNQSVEDVTLELSNTTDSYYYYHKYRSDSFESNSATYISPTIAGKAINVRTAKALCNFSGIAPTFKTFKIK